MLDFIKTFLFGPKLTAYIVYPFGISFPEYQTSLKQTIPSRIILSHTLIIRNDGFATATNVVIKHKKGIPNGNVGPEYASYKQESDGSVIFYNIPPRQYVSIGYMYHDSITAHDIHYLQNGKYHGISYDGGIIAIKNGVQELSFPIWKRWYFWILLIIGYCLPHIHAIINWIAKLV